MAGNNHEIASKGPEKQENFQPEKEVHQVAEKLLQAAGAYTPENLKPAGSETNFEAHDKQVQKYISDTGDSFASKIDKLDDVHKQVMLQSVQFYVKEAEKEDPAIRQQLKQFWQNLENRINVHGN